MEMILPKGWVQTKLFDAVISVPTNVKKYEGVKKYYSTGSISHEIIEEGEYDFNSKPSRAKREVLENDILQARMKNTNKAFLIDKKYENELFSTGFLQLRPLKNTILSKYIFYYLNSSVFLNQKDELSTGATQQSINDANAGKLDFPLPPLAEQERIVAKLDTLFAQHELMKKALDRIPQVLKDFRQQVLTQAVTGKLTEQWREGKDLKEWKEEEIENLLIKKGIFDGPFGSNLKTEDYSDIGEVRVVRLENIDTLSFIDSKKVFITEEKFNSLKRHEVFENDIIFSSFISEKIRACILPFSNEKRIAKADCFCLRVDKEKMINEFLLYSLVNNTMYSKLLKETRGATRPRINTSILKKATIKFPFLEEQQEIVSRVESLFAKADAIEARYQTLKAKIESLPKALLHKAFKGELVPQLPTDGDAKDLIAEIMALKKEVKGKKK